MGGGCARPPLRALVVLLCLGGATAQETCKKGTSNFEAKNARVYPKGTVSFDNFAAGNTIMRVTPDQSGMEAITTVHVCDEGGDNNDCAGSNPPGYAQDKGFVAPGETVSIDICFENTATVTKVGIPPFDSIPVTIKNGTAVAFWYGCQRTGNCEVVYGRDGIVAGGGTKIGLAGKSDTPDSQGVTAYLTEHAGPIQTDSNCRDAAGNLVGSPSSAPILYDSSAAAIYANEHSMYSCPTGWLHFNQDIEIPARSTRCFATLLATFGEAPNWVGDSTDSKDMSQYGDVIFPQDASDALDLLPVSKGDMSIRFDVLDGNVNNRKSNDYIEIDTSAFGDCTESLTIEGVNSIQTARDFSYTCATDTPSSPLVVCDGLGEVDRPSRNLISCADPNSPNSPGICTNATCCELVIVDDCPCPCTDSESDSSNDGSNSTDTEDTDDEPLARRLQVENADDTDDSSDMCNCCSSDDINDSVGDSNDGTADAVEAIIELREMADGRADAHKGDRTKATQTRSAIHAGTEEAAKTFGTASWLQQSVGSLTADGDTEEQVAEESHASDLCYPWCCPCKPRRVFLIAALAAVGLSCGAMAYMIRQRWFKSNQQNHKARFEEHVYDAKLWQERQLQQDRLKPAKPDAGSLLPVIRELSDPESVATGGSLAGEETWKKSVFSC